MVLQAPVKEDNQRHVVVIGGGITGLSAAWFLQQQDNVRYTLLEQSGRWGGKIHTETIETEDGAFVVEYGPDAFVTQKPQARQLAESIGIGEQLIGTNMDNRKIYLLNRKRLMPLPDGMMLIIPTRFAPFVFSPLISPLGKLRMAMEIFIPAKDGNEDESISDFVRRRLGQEAVDKLAEPLLSGIFNTNPEQQSLLTTFPRFRALETKYGSMTRGMIAARKHMPKHPTSPFTSLRDGMETLIDELVAKLTGDLRLNTTVDTLTHHDDNTYSVTLANGSVLEADAVILATPAQATEQLLQDIAPEAGEIVGGIPHVTTGTVSLAYHESDLPYPLDGHGVVAPRKAQRAINAITWSSSKFNNRAPEGYALLRVFFGGSRSPQTLELDDEQLEATVKAELRDIMGIEADPVFTRIYRTHNAIPQYFVGHNDNMAALEKLLPTGIQLAGAAYRGAGVPDCVNSAEQAVEQILSELQPVPVA